MLSEAILSIIENPTEEEIKKTAEPAEQKIRGITLRKIRTHLGASQKLFAEILGISEEDLDELESNGIDADKLQKIQETYGS